jgi:hypothetical protein
MEKYPASYSLQNLLSVYRPLQQDHVLANQSNFIASLAAAAAAASSTSTHLEQPQLL